MASTLLSPILRSSRPRSITTLCQTCTLRQFTTTTSRSSQIGKTPIIVPPEVTVSVYTPPEPKGFTRNPPTPTATVSGPLGTLTIPIPRYLTIKHEDGATGKNTKTMDASSSSSSSTSSTAAAMNSAPVSTRILVSVENPKIKQQHAMWGTTRAYLQNHILGVTEGHAAILRFVGVGYRAIVEEKIISGQKKTIVNLKLGYSHPIEMVVPEGVKAQAPVPTRLLLEGLDRQVVMQFAADVRAWRKPEPYKGKAIRLKAKKIK